MSEEPDTENLFSKTLTWIAARLNSLEISYMITGGSAVGFWGHMRTTMDIDMVIRIQPGKVPVLARALKDEAYVSEEDISEAVSGRGMFNIILNETAFKIDFAPLDEKNAYEVEKFARRIRLAYEGADLWVISPEDLVLSKLKWMKSAGGSERQLSDCRSIMELNKGALDLAYMRRWAPLIGVDKEYSSL